MERYKKIQIRPGFSIKQAFQHMDAMGEKTLVVIDEGQAILGTVSDGDIRRWILKGRELNDKVTCVLNPRPVLLKEGFAGQEAKDLFLKHKIECLPVADAANRMVSCVFWADLFEKKQIVSHALKLPVVIMAGGEGVRLHPFTKILPKPLMPIGEKPIIEVIIDRFLEYGCEDFYLSLNYKSNLIKAYFNDFEHRYKINYVQESKPLGTAGGLHLLRNKIKKTLFVSNCDILIEADYADVLKFHRQKNNKITLVTSMKNMTIPYGVCRIQNGGILKGIREKPEYDFLVNTGMYVLEPSVLKQIPSSRYYNITDLINHYLSLGEKVGAYPVSEKSWLDIGQIEVLHEALKKFELRERAADV